MKIGIIGAGFTGLSAGYELLKKGHEVSIFERDSHPGGLAIGYKENGWDWTLESFYHHWFTNDYAILNLAKELNYNVITTRPKTSSLIKNKIYQLDSPITLLKFSKLSLAERIRMGSVLAFLRYNPFWKPLESRTTMQFLSHTIGKRAYKILWEPLLKGKFGNYADEISLAWFWARIRKRTTQLSYPEGGFLKFAETLTNKIKTMKGKVFFNVSIERVMEENNKVNLGKFGLFDKVIVTLPGFIFSKIAPQLPENYKVKLTNLKGLGACVLILRLKKQFFSDNTYWLNICNSNSPLLAIVEHTNMISSKYYNNEHIVYLGNYLPPTHPYFYMPEKELLKTFDPLLIELNSNYKNNIIGMRKFTTPFAQPIIPVNYSKMIPPFETPLKNVYLANMQQVYPWDRGTNYAVELGEKVAKLI